MLNKRKHKKFNYQSRFSEDNEIDNETNNDLKRDIENEWRKGSRRNKKSRLPLYLILLGIIIVVLYYLETQIG